MSCVRRNTHYTNVKMVPIIIIIIIITQSGLQNNENNSYGSHSPWETLPQQNNIGSIKQSLGRAASQQSIINSHNRILSTEEYRTPLIHNRTLSTEEYRTSFISLHQHH